MNFIILMYYFNALIISILGIFVNFKLYLKPPLWLEDFYNYGKLHSAICPKSVFQDYLKVPKRWFLHFYITSSIASVASLGLFISVAIVGEETSPLVTNLLNTLTSTNRSPACSTTTALIVLCLFSCHAFKRLYENAFVSVMSEGAQMNVAHYALGHAHYAAAFVGLLSAFPGFAAAEVEPRTCWVWVALGAATVACSSLAQHAALSSLARLRKRRDGGIDEGKRSTYSMPLGGLFAFVSCPHMLAETGVYVGLAATMRFRHATCNAAAIFVACNQIQVALLNHGWYRRTFGRAYPAARKAIVPFLI